MPPRNSSTADLVGGIIRRERGGNRVPCALAHGSQGLLTRYPLKRTSCIAPEIASPYTNAGSPGLANVRGRMGAWADQNAESLGAPQPWTMLFNAVGVSEKS